MAVNFAGYAPTGWQRGDEFIEDDICTLFARDRTLDATGIQVEVNAGSITLSGYVPTQQARTTAHKIAMGVYGVKALNDHLTIGASTGAQQPNAQSASSGSGSGKSRT